MTDEVGPGAQAEKKPNWFLRIVLGVLAGGMLLFALGTFLVYRWVKRPENQERFGAVGEVMKLAVQSAAGPGTAELRALGCKSAVVMDGRSLKQVADNVEKLAGKKAPSDEPPEDEIPEELVSVICTTGRSSDVDCAAVAKTYAAAVTDEPESFMVLVQSQGFGDEQQKCLGMYAPDGTMVEDLKDD